MRGFRLAAAASLLFCALAQAAVASDFTQLPGLEDAAKVYPRAAASGNFGGRVMLRCKVAPEAAVEGCAVISEAPSGLEFGAAALALASLIKVDARLAIGDAVEAPIEFLPLQPAPPIFKKDSRYPMFPGVGPYYPLVAADAGLTGQVLLSCQRGLTGQLNECKVLAEAPQRADFGGAALRMAERRWLTVAPRDSGPAQVGEPVAVLVPFTIRARR